MTDRLNLSFLDKEETQTKRRHHTDDMDPYFAEGEVVKGFGRGSKELGIPTANFPESVVDCLPESLGCGVYYGWASVDSGEVHGMVMSIGWNPYYKNTKKSMETHILHNFTEDFYGHILKVIILGFIRPMKNFSSLDELITEIHADIAFAQDTLQQEGNNKYKSHSFFSTAKICPLASL